MGGFRAWWSGKGSGTVVLDEAESRHLVRVLRAREGDSVTLFDGRGQAWAARLTNTTGREAVCVIEEELAVPHLGVNLALAVVLPKGKTFDGIVRQAVEIGADDIIPLQSERGEARLDAARAEAKRAHWIDLVREAVKQSGNLRPPRIARLTPLKELLKRAEDWPRRLVASLQDNAKPLASNRHLMPPMETLLLVGPEGDFSPAEYEAIAAVGFNPVRLANHVLRVETACAYGLSVLDASRPRSSKIA